MPFKTTTPIAKTPRTPIPDWVSEEVAEGIRSHKNHFRIFDFGQLSLREAREVTKAEQAKCEFKVFYDIQADRKTDKVMGIFYNPRQSDNGADILFDNVTVAMQQMDENKLTVDFDIDPQVIRYLCKTIKGDELDVSFSVGQNQLTIWGADAEKFAENYEQLRTTEQSWPVCIFDKKDNAHARFLGDCIVAANELQDISFVQTSRMIDGKMVMTLTAWGEDVATFKEKWDEAHEKHVFEMPAQLVDKFVQKTGIAMSKDDMYIGCCGRYSLVLPFGKHRDEFYTAFLGLWERMTTQTCTVNSANRIALCDEVAKDVRGITYWVDRNGPISLTGCPEDIAAFKAALTTAAKEKNMQMRGR